MNYRDYVFYVCDTETTGLDFYENDVIELCLNRLSFLDNGETSSEFKTWRIQPINFNTIQEAALKVNGHQLKDLKHETKYGIDTYIKPDKAIIDIENWVSEDNTPANKRILIGQNIQYDKNMLEFMWKKLSSHDSFPFGYRMIDTMTIELSMDLSKKDLAEGYSLSNLAKKYGVKNDKAHTAESDVKATTEIFLKQLSSLQK